MTGESVSVYELPNVRKALGDALRPGGLALTDEAMAACGLPRGARLLDVGCGAGSTVAHLRDHHGLMAAGLDVSCVLLRSARTSSPELPLALARGERLPVCGGALDAVLAECSLSVMAEVGAVLAEFRRVLKSGGRLIIADLYLRAPDGLTRAGARRPVSCLSGALTRTQIERALAGQGFDLLVWQDRSEALKVLAARLILAGVSPARYWGAACAAATDSTAHQKPGYFWLVAEKGGFG